MDIKVDELLASIRKTMDNDIDSLSTSMNTQTRGTLMRGALREMRVNLGLEEAEAPLGPPPRVRPANEDLPTLRDRIRRKVEENEILAAAQPAPPSPSQSAQAYRSEPQQAPRGDFSNIMALPQPGYDEPELRRGFDHDVDDLRYAAPPPPQQSWQRHYQEPRYAEPPRALMAPHVEEATAQAFQQLSDAIMQRALGDRSLEEMTRDILRGHIKQWVDAHLPALVEAIVREEIERVSRGGR